MQTIDQFCAGFSPERRTKITEEVACVDHAEMPWYLRVIIAIGAWLAAVFFILCARSFFGALLEQSAVGAVGLFILAVAILVNRLDLGFFGEQCTLAVSLAGQAMIYYGYVPNSDQGTTLTEFSAVMATVLYLVYPNFLSRLITCFFALQITLWWMHPRGSGPLESWLMEGSSYSMPLTLFWIFQLALLVICFLPAQMDRFLVPLGYAVALSLAAWQIEDRIPLLDSAATGTPHFAGSIFHFSTHAILTALPILGVALWCAGGISRAGDRQALFIVLIAALLVLVALGSTGVLLALLLMLLGFSLQKRPLFGLGFLLLPLFLVEYYYSLNVSLLTKSMILAGSGAALLALRAVLMRYAFTKEAA